MDRKRMLAGNIRSVGYDESSRLLEVEMANGDILEHPGVGREIARRLLASGSAWSGSALTSHIHNCNFSQCCGCTNCCGRKCS
jgi:hypothetical protein